MKQLFNLSTSFVINLHNRNHPWLFQILFHKSSYNSLVYFYRSDCSDDGDSKGRIHRYLKSEVSSKDIKRRPSSWWNDNRSQMCKSGEDDKNKTNLTSVTWEVWILRVWCVMRSVGCEVWGRRTCVKWEVGLQHYYPFFWLTFGITLILLLQYSVEKRRNLFFLTSLGYQSQMFTQEESTLLHIFRCKLILKFIVAKFLNTSATYAITVQLIISIARAFKFIIVPCEANMLTAMASRTRVYGCVKKMSHWH